MPKNSQTYFLHGTLAASEINTLGYPQAALFGFCVALVAYNALAVVFAALRAVHGTQTIDHEVSGYYIANEITHRNASWDDNRHSRGTLADLCNDVRSGVCRDVVATDSQGALTGLS